MPVSASTFRGSNVLDPEKLWPFRYRGLIGIAVLLPAGAATLLSRPRIAPGSALDLTLDLIGWASFITGCFLRIWATLYVGCRKRSTLVMDGPYSICRNPLYLGTFFLSLSTGLFLKSALLTSAVGLLALAYNLATVPCEETFLRREHGSLYDRYCREVARFWPSFSSFRSGEVVEVKVKGLKIELKRLCVWIWLPFLTHVITHLRMESWWPALFHGF